MLKNLYWILKEKMNDFCWFSVRGTVQVWTQFSRKTCTFHVVYLSNFDWVSFAVEDPPVCPPSHKVTQCMSKCYLHAENLEFMKLSFPWSQPSQSHTVSKIKTLTFFFGVWDSFAWGIEHHVTPPPYGTAERLGVLRTAKLQTKLNFFLIFAFIFKEDILYL